MASAETIALYDTVTRWLNHLTFNNQDRYALEKVLFPMADLIASRPLNSAGLVINGVGTKVAKIGATDFYGLANGTLVKIAAATAMPALSGTVTNAKFNVFCLDVDSGGTVTATMGTEGATLAAVVFPARLKGQCRLGFIIINPTGTGNFVGGTTNLDDATVVPNAAYVNPQAGFDQSIVL